MTFSYADVSLEIVYVSLWAIMVLHSFLSYVAPNIYPFTTFLCICSRCSVICLFKTSQKVLILLPLMRPVSVTFSMPSFLPHYVTNIWAVPLSKQISNNYTMIAIKIVLTKVRPSRTKIFH